MSTSDAALELKVSKSTIRNWIKKGKLTGRIFRQVRIQPGIYPPARKYHITKESIAQVQKALKGDD
ncbi:MAG: helix-turn-helix domain-containing protein [Chloroflexi bacterium]|nr:helix-turn-helix domain-containing protein [Chloroflexota bacterium]